MNQYEKRWAMDDIDGYWSPPVHRTQENIEVAFEKAKEEFRVAMNKRIASVDAITLEQFAKFKGKCWVGPYETNQ